MKDTPVACPSLVASADAAEALQGAWRTARDGARRCKDLVMRANDHEREALRVIANAFGALMVVIARGDAEELGKLSTWARRQEERALSIPPPVPRLDRFRVARESELTQLPISPSPNELARAIDRRWRRTTDAARRWDVEMGRQLFHSAASQERPLDVSLPPCTGVGHIQIVTLYPPGALDMPVESFEFGVPPMPGDVWDQIVGTSGMGVGTQVLTRIEVARDLARSLQALCEPWFDAGNEADLADRVCRRMPWSRLSRAEHPAARPRQDSEGVAFHEPFSEDYRKTIRAAFRAAAKPGELDDNVVKNLFKSKGE